MAIRLIAYSLYFMVQIALSACGSLNNASSQVPAPAPSLQPAELVQVTLSDEKIDSSRVFFVVGRPYRFVVTNRDKVPRAWQIESRGESDRSKVLLEIEAEELLPGDQATREYVFAEAADLQITSSLPGRSDGEVKLAIAARNRSLQIANTLPW